MDKLKHNRPDNLAVLLSTSLALLALVSACDTAPSPTSTPSPDMPNITPPSLFMLPDLAESLFTGCNVSVGTVELDQGRVIPVFNNQTLEVRNPPNPYPDEIYLTDSSGNITFTTLSSTQPSTALFDQNDTIIIERNPAEQITIKVIDCP